MYIWYIGVNALNKGLKIDTNSTAVSSTNGSGVGTVTPNKHASSNSNNSNSIMKSMKTPINSTVTPGITSRVHKSPSAGYLIPSPRSVNKGVLSAPRMKSFSTVNAINNSSISSSRSLLNNSSNRFASNSTTPSHVYNTDTIISASSANKVSKVLNTYYYDNSNGAPVHDHKQIPHIAMLTPSLRVMSDFPVTVTNPIPTLQLHQVNSKWLDNIREWKYQLDWITRNTASDSRITKLLNMYMNDLTRITIDTRSSNILSLHVHYKQSLVKLYF